MMEGDHAVEGIGRYGIQMAGILGYQVPPLFELLQIIGIEKMGAGFLAKPLIVEVYRFFVDNGMEQACEELTAKNSIRLLELYDWHISRVDGNIKTRA